MEDLTGRRFGRWTVISRATEITRRPVWNCRCDCGTEKKVRGATLINGESRSCGCLQRELLSERVKRHGGFGTRLYAIWNSMRQRCNNPKHHAYENYGGRGIHICPEWDDFGVFRAWAYSMGYDDNANYGDCTLDRIDVDKDYSPDNCRFVSMHVQSCNRRDSISVEHNGETHPLTEWAVILGKDYSGLWKKYKEGKDIFN